MQAQSISNSNSHVGHDPSISRSESVCWRGLRVVGNFLLETGAKVACFVLLGLAAGSLFPPAMNPFFTVALATVLSRLVVKVIDRINPARLDRFKAAIDLFASKYPVQIIAIVVILAVAPFFEIGAIVIGAGFGCVNGFLLGVEWARTSQQANADDDDSDDEDEPPAIV